MNRNPDLNESFSDRTSKQRLVDWVFDSVADRYDLGNDVMSLGFHMRWKRRAIDLARIEPGHRVLDLACGTGDTTFMAARVARGTEVVGVDVSEAMMSVARAKHPPDADNVSFVNAAADALPFEDASFDRVTCTYAGRGFPDWPGVIREVHRVLRPSGRFVNLDFARPPLRPWDWAYRTWLMGSGAVLGAALHGNPRTYMYIPVSMRHYPGQRWLHTELENGGFEATLHETTGWFMAFNVGVREA